MDDDGARGVVWRCGEWMLERGRMRAVEVETTAVKRTRVKRVAFCEDVLEDGMFTSKCSRRSLHVRNHCILRVSPS